ncbi:NifB/NifX family molybdenum-iron cluster-binding protein [Desulfocurvus sp. DL9XJH121]
MLLCLACYGDRLASLAENADQYRLYRVQDGHAEPEGGIAPPDRDPASLARAMAACGVREFVCGGITGCCRRHLEITGVRVRPWVSGDVDEVLAAWNAGGLEALSMPGCGGPRCDQPGLGRGCGGMRNRNQSCARGAGQRPGGRKWETKS